MHVFLQINDEKRNTCYIFLSISIDDYHNRFNMFLYREKFFSVFFFKIMYSLFFIGISQSLKKSLLISSSLKLIQLSEYI